jgi:outer membrane usher protein
VSFSGARPFLCILLLGLVATSPSGAEDGLRAILRLSVNRVDQGEVIVVLRAGDVLVRVADLEQAGLRDFAGTRQIASGEIHVSLASLSPGVTFEFDERALALRLTAEPSFLASRVLDLGVDRPPGIVYRDDTSAFLNYALSLTDFDKYAVFTEAGLHVMGALLFGSASRNEDGTVVRGLTNVTFDDRSRLTRWVLGDRFVTSDALGGSLLMGGLSASREFAIDPYFLSFPQVELAGAVTTPSTADIYVNGRLLRREPLAPGTFELRNLPAPTGSGTARVVIRDAFGREREIASPFYLTTSLLSEGLHEYTYNVGFRRDHVATENWDYTRPGFLGRHRFGFTDTLTAGGRLEAAADLVSGGPTLTLDTHFGEVELSAAASHEREHFGAGGSLAYRYSARPVSLGASVRALTDRYATLSLRARDDRPRIESSGFVGTQLGSRTDLTVQYTRSEFRDRGPEDQASILSTIQLTDRASLFLSVSRSTQKHAKSTTEAFAGLSIALGERTTGSLSYQRQGDQNVGSIDVQRSLPVGPGFGYRVHADASGDTAAGGVTVQYQGPYGRYEASYERVNGENTSVLSAAGGVVAIGGALFATRPVSDGFALIRVPGVAGVQGYLNNQEIGRTDANGDLPVPDLLAYYGNRLRIADQDIPLEYAVGSTEQTVATPLRGGALVNFPVRLLRAVTGKLILDEAGTAVVPAYGQLAVTAGGQRLDSPIGRDGEFYLDSLPPGRHAAEVEHEGARCTFVLEVPPAAGSVISLGTLRCPAHEDPTR